MSKKAIVIPNALAPAGPCSQGIVANGFLYTAGFGPKDPQTGKVQEGFAEQTRQVLRNIEAVLTEAGGSFADVVKVTTHLQHLKRDFDEYNKAYVEFFPAPFPVRTTVGSDLYDILVEIDVVVALPRQGLRARHRSRLGRPARTCRGDSVWRQSSLTYSPADAPNRVLVSHSRLLLSGVAFQSGFRMPLRPMARSSDQLLFGRSVAMAARLHGADEASLPHGLMHRRSTAQSENVEAWRATYDLCTDRCSIDFGVELSGDRVSGLLGSFSSRIRFGSHQSCDDVSFIGKCLLCHRSGRRQEAVPARYPGSPHP
jgi:2-iminobutanoate/2-iminopropanoate deaminase